MKRGDFHSSIRSVMQLFLDLNLMGDIKLLTSHTPTEEFRQAAMSDLPYCEVFRIGLENRDYNFALTDRSFFQFHLADHPYLELRYAFYPNPYSALSFQSFLEQFPEAAEEDGGLEEYSQYLSEQPNEQPVPPIRYDFAPRQYQELVHPTAHFHFGVHSGNRWPVGLKLSPLAFALQTTKMFYADAWARGLNFETGRNELDQQFQSAKSECALLDAAEFSAAERALIHIA